MQNVTIYLKKERLPNSEPIAELLKQKFTEQEDMKSFLNSSTKSIPGTMAYYKSMEKNVEAMVK